MMSFIFPFMNFFQPGVFWKEIAAYKPMLVLSLLAFFIGLAGKSVYPRKEAFSHPAIRWLMVFLGIQIISLIGGGIASMFTGLEYWSAYILFVIASVMLVRDEKTLSRYVWGMMVGSMVIVVFGIMAVYGPWDEAKGGRAGAYGMYENHNDYSFIIIQIFPFLYLYRKVTKGFVGRLLLWAAMGACLWGIVLSLSRGGMMALVLEMALIILIGMEGKKRLWLLPALLIAGAAAISIQFALRAENQGKNYTAADAENSRLELWRAGGNMVLDHPLLGVGSMHFYEYAREYGEISHDNRGKNTHNTYLEILTGTGLIGFFCFVGMVVKLTRSLHRAAAIPSSPLIDATRRATLIAFYSMLFRATLDAKPHDWSFYILCTIGITCILIQRHANLAEKTPAVQPVSKARLPSYGRLRS
jgi:O-antigen ligase